MIRSTATLLFALATLFATAVSTPAVAHGEPDYVGARFSIGNVQFKIVNQDYRHRHGRHYSHGHDGVFFRASAPFSYRHYRCGSFCHRVKSDYYHHASCPLARGFIAAHRPRLSPLLALLVGKSRSHDHRWGNRYYDNRGHGRHDRGHDSYGRGSHGPHGSHDDGKGRRR